ncbi:MAG: dihydroneopterin aldolase [Rickettsiales bacterium]|nr:dihydroneopterin aldolase [Rickettsiales bacterium]
MKMPFTIYLNDLKLQAKLGVFEWERKEIREFLTHVEIELKTDKGIHHDDLSSTIDYAELERFLLNHAATQEWQLIERLLESLADGALNKFLTLDRITLTLHKPQALEESNVAVKYSKTRT